MAWFISIGIILILILILLLFQIKIRTHYCYQKNNHHLTVHVYYMRMRVFHRKININEYTIDEPQLIEFLNSFSKEDENVSLKKILNKVSKQIGDVNKLLKLMIKSITIEEFKWITHFGTGDASSTGTLAGGVWALKGTLVGYLFDQTDMRSKPRISVIPHFQQKGLYSEIDCIVTIRLGKAIRTGIQLLRNLNFKEEVYI